MEHTRSRIIILAFLILCFTYIGNNNFNISPSQDIIDSNNPKQFSSSHEPITIASDEDLANYWPGNGTSNEPYLIQGLNITTTGFAISIRNTRAHLLISDCNISSTSTSTLDLFNVSNVIVENNTFDDVYSTCVLAFLIWNCSFINNWMCYSGSNGFWIDYAENCVITENALHYNSEHGIVLRSSIHVSIIRNSFIGNRMAITMPWNNYCQIKMNNITDHWQSGLRLTDSHNCSISENNISANSGNGIWLGLTSNLNISKNRIHHNLINGIDIDGSPYSSIDGNIIYNNSYNGIDFEDSDNNTLCKNFIFNNTQRGILCSTSSNCSFTENIITNNRFGGITFSGITDSIITQNRIIENTMKGITIYSCSGLKIYYNEIGWNLDGNAVDNGNSNQWDDGISLGNWWDDYIGGPFYSISGTANSVDRWPQLLRMSSLGFDVIPIDFGYEYGMKEQNILWIPFSDTPSSFRVFRNQSLFDEGPWDGSSISVNVDSLDVGVWEIVLYIFDIYNSSKSDSVVVTVLPDTTNPSINHLDDIVLYNDELPSDLVWFPTDLNPQLFSIYFNDILLKQELWNGSQVIFTIEPTVALGTHNITIVISDTFGNTISDTVSIQVITSELPTSTTTTTTTTTIVTSTSTDTESSSTSILTTTDTNTGITYDNGIMIISLTIICSLGLIILLVLRKR